MKKKILILYTSKGLGHKVIAENIGWHLQQAGYEIKFGDLLKIQAGKLVWLGDKIHTFINTYLAGFWKWLYMSRLFTDLTLPLRLKVAAKNSGKALQLIREYNPDYILVTQGSFAGVVAHLKQAGLCPQPLVIGFSDYHLHRYWLYEEADYYLANIPEQKEAMVRLGIPAERISVCGITLKPLSPADPIEVRSKIGLLSTEHLVVLAAGSLGIGIKVKHVQGLVRALHRQSRARGLKVVLAIICGKNEKLYRTLSDLNLPNVKVYSYYMPLAELYQVADVYLTKPGGLSMAEALAYRLPVLLTHFLPGQEELNLDYLLKKEVVMGYIPLSAPERVAHRVMEEIQTGEFRRKLAKNPEIDELSPTDGRAVVEAFDSRVAKY